MSVPGITRCVLSVVLALLFGTAATAEQPPMPRYRCNPGDRFSYDVKIVIDLGDEVRTLAGAPTLVVTSLQEGEIELKLEGGLKTERQRKQPQPAGPDPFGPHFDVRPPFAGDPFARRSAQNQLTITERGRIAGETGSEQLPFMLDGLAHLLLAPFPEANEPKWSLTREISFSVQDANPSAFPHAGFPPQPTKRLRADETVTFEVMQSADKGLKLVERYELKSVSTVKGKPRIEVMGEGTATIDPATGALTERATGRTLTIREGNTTIEVPITISVKLRCEAAAPAELPPTRSTAARRREVCTSEEVSHTASLAASPVVAHSAGTGNALGLRKTPEIAGA